MNDSLVRCEVSPRKSQSFLQNGSLKYQEASTIVWGEKGLSPGFPKIVQHSSCKQCSALPPFCHFNPEEHQLEM